MRRFILCLLGVAALAVTAIAILPSLISSDWMRAELGRQLSAATGSSIAFNGPVKLSAFPYLAVVAEDVTLSAEAEGITAEFAEVAGSVALSSLWSDRLHIKQIALDRPVVVLDEKAPGDATPAPGGGDATASGDPLPALVAFLERSAIESVSITSGTFVQRSAGNPEEVVSDVELTLTAPTSMTSSLFPPPPAWESRVTRRASPYRPCGRCSSASPPMSPLPWKRIRLPRRA